MSDRTAIYCPHCREPARQTNLTRMVAAGEDHYEKQRRKLKTPSWLCTNALCGLQFSAPHRGAGGLAPEVSP